MTGKTIGILGGGQLGLMTAQAALSLGVESHVFCSSPEEPALSVAAQKTVAPFDDEAALVRFAQSVSAATVEWENIPLSALELVARHVPVFPSPSVLRIAQDRGLEKGFARDCGIGTPAFEIVRSPEDLARAAEKMGRPAVLKSTRMGYDGKGQVLLTPDLPVTEAWTRMGSTEGILESFVAFEREISVIVARRSDGAKAVYPPVENSHEKHILKQTTFPANLDSALRQEAVAAAEKLADALKVTGLLAVEMFVLKVPDAQGRRILMNEIAPRPHNSGHWTIDACPCSQFEQLVRIMCDLPLGETATRFEGRMINLLGEEISQTEALKADPKARIHSYGKKDVKPGRKMGHVTFLDKAI